MNEVAANQRQGNKKKFIVSVRGNQPKHCTKENSLKLTLRSNPSEDSSPTFEEVVPFLQGNETVAEVYSFFRLLQQVFKGQNLKDGSSQATMAIRLMQNECKTKFESCIQGKEPLTTNDVEAALREVAKLVLPPKALTSVKRYLRRYAWKPDDIDVSHWMTGMRWIREEIIVFLASVYHNYKDKEGKDNPFNPQMALIPMDEFLDLCHQYIKETWVGQMALQNFEPTEHTPEEFVAFCKTLEFAENTHGNLEPRNFDLTATKPYFKKKGGKGNQPIPAGPKKRKFCSLHKECSHTTDDCRDIQAMIAQLQGNKPANQQVDGSNKRPKFGNKTWTRTDNNNANGDKKPKAFDKAKYKKYKESQELQAFVAMAAKKAARKEFQAFLAEQQNATAQPIQEAEAHAVDAQPAKGKKSAAEEHFNRQLSKLNLSDDEATEIEIDSDNDSISC